MAQGPLKKKPSSATSASKRPNALGPKKGARVIAPRKKKLVEQKRLTKRRRSDPWQNLQKYSGGLIRKTEANLAEKAGHLEMLAGGKKSKKGALGGKTKGK
ncbi:MAG: hypothetical protein Q9182_000248 [Xanthomendoza sp. 2 TL-2023]